jgi:hypothetical protein
VLISGHPSPWSSDLPLSSSRTQPAFVWRQQYPATRPPARDDRHPGRLRQALLPGALWPARSGGRPGQPALPQPRRQPPGPRLPRGPLPRRAAAAGARLYSLRDQDGNPLLLDAWGSNVVEVGT